MEEPSVHRLSFDLLTTCSFHSTVLPANAECGGLGPLRTPLDSPDHAAHATAMIRARLAGLAVLAVGAVIVLYRLRVDGLALSFTLLLGALLIVDGVLRLALAQE